MECLNVQKGAKFGKKKVSAFLVAEANVFDGYGSFRWFNFILHNVVRQLSHTYTKKQPHTQESKVWAPTR